MRYCPNCFIDNDKLENSWCHISKLANTPSQPVVLVNEEAEKETEEKDKEKETNEEKETDEEKETGQLKTVHEDSRRLEHEDIQVKETVSAQQTLTVRNCRCEWGHNNMVLFCSVYVDVGGKYCYLPY